MPLIIDWLLLFYCFFQPYANVQKLLLLLWPMIISDSMECIVFVVTAGAAGGSGGATVVGAFQLFCVGWHVVIVFSLFHYNRT